MISKSWLKLIKSLQIKKFRVKEGLFIVEGAKSVLELVNSDYKIQTIFCTDSFYSQHLFQLKKVQNSIQIVTEKELAETGTFSTNNAALAVVSIKEERSLKIDKGEFALILDEVKDPGNLGTIIRIADWFGIKKIICSIETVDFYNPKVISSTMGSFTRVEIMYTDLEGYLKQVDKKTPVFGAFIEGENIHEVAFPSSGYIVMGNESSGISTEVEAFVNKKITIPRFGNAESLNVAVATAIVLDNLKRWQNR
jgi:RNA methyltransferase, TrmH family